MVVQLNKLGWPGCLLLFHLGREVIILDEILDILKEILKGIIREIIAYVFRKNFLETKRTTHRRGQHGGSQDKHE